MLNKLLLHGKISLFLSKEDLKKRGKVSQTIIAYLTQNSVLDGMPDENQLSLFDF